MRKFTVVWYRDAKDDLADLWLSASDPGAVTLSANEIDRRLAEDPKSAILENHEGLCSLIVEPLLIQYSFDELDCKVTVWTVRLIDK